LHSPKLAYIVQGVKNGHKLNEGKQQPLALGSAGEAGEEGTSGSATTIEFVNTVV